MASLSAGKLHTFHGGEFQRLSNLIYIACECSEVEIDTNYLSADDMKKIVYKLEYKENNIKTIYFYKTNLPFEELVAIDE